MVRYGSRIASTYASGHISGKGLHFPAKPASQSEWPSVHVITKDALSAFPTPMTHKLGRKTAPSGPERPESRPGEHPPISAA